MEHYSDLYCKENTVSHSALEAIERLPTMDELDAEPTVVDFSKAIDSLVSGKAPGSEGIPPDLIKHCKTTLASASTARGPLPVLARRKRTARQE